MGTELQDIEVNQYQVQVSCMLMAVVESAPRCTVECSMGWEQQLERQD